MSSQNDYGKVDEAENERLLAHRRTRKRMATIVISSVLLVAIIVGAVVGTCGSGGYSNVGGDQTGSKSISSSVKAVCDVTLYQEACYNSLVNKANPDKLQPEVLFKLSILVALEELSNASSYFFKDGQAFLGAKENMTLAALQDCQDVLGLAIDHLNSSLLTSGATLYSALDDLRCWLSTALTCHQTCIDGLVEVNSNVNAEVYLKNSTELTSNSIAIVTWLQKLASTVNLRRRLMSDRDGSSDRMPHWLRPRDRKLLESTDVRQNADFVVARDGSGMFKTIGAAIDAVPDNSKTRVVIYVKNGVYSENVLIPMSKRNVMIVGDGMSLTIVTGNKNFVDGTPTFQSATFAVFGQGFIAQDIGFRNTAGAIKQQAVALLSTSDQSVFYRCSIDAFQDTLYTHSNRQFYRECQILGTVDFIFGNSAVVIQDCNILPKKPIPGQQNTITAQGKIDPNQNTGIAIQKCTIWPAAKLSGVQTFLGRPWKNYSTTVYMESTFGSLIDPNGWLPWIGTVPATIFYVEYQNYGPGSSTKNRVQWKGLKLNHTANQVAQFTVKPFIQGNKWIPGSGAEVKFGL